VFNNSADAMKLIAILLRVEEQIRSVEHFAIRLMLRHRLATAETVKVAHIRLSSVGFQS